jgi:Amt family ammonium transporter
MWSRRVSGLGFCSGAVSALVAITPSAGYVAPWAAIIIGAIAGITCNLACRVKGYFGFDDALDAWGVHGVGGFIGNILTGIFAQKWVAGLDNSVIGGGAIDGNWIQLGYQTGASFVIAAYSFVLSFIILTAINYIPGLHLRPSEDDEILGGDLGEMGEVAYELVSSFIEPTPEMAAASGSKLEATVVV